MNRRTLVITFLAAVTAATAWQSGTLYARQAAKPAPAKQRFVTATGALMKDEFLPDGESFLTLNGDVKIWSDDATLTTEKATYNGSTQIAVAPTRLQLDDKQNTLTADKGTAYYSTRDADFSGNVVIVARPKQGNGGYAPKGSLRRNFKDPVRITCEKVRYNWRTKRAVLTGKLTIKQKDRTITGDRGLYDGITETVTLVGNIKSRRPTGETGDAPGANARAVACFTEGGEYVTVTRDPGAKAGKVRAVVPVRETGNGEVEVVESVDAPVVPPADTEPEPSPLPDVSPAPTP